MSAPSVFGLIPGFPPGTTFASREELRAAGLHRRLQAGISGNYSEGADAIVMSGGYGDDRDEGDRILYTGQGGRDSSGRQVAHQQLERGNRALALNSNNGLPVRVIRGSGADPKYSSDELEGESTESCAVIARLDVKHDIDLASNQYQRKRIARVWR